MRFRVGAHWTFATSRYSKVDIVFTVSRSRAPSLASASAQWVESYFAVTRRHYKVVALCSTDMLAVVQLQLQKALGQRRIKDSVTRLTACDHELTRLCLEFEAGDSERNCLNETVRRLCTMPGIRYVRLEPQLS
jgi:hypothetical protein